MVAVAGEFILSVYLQTFRNFSPLVTGLILLSASLGVIFGSLKLARSQERDFDKKIKNGLKGMLLASVLMGLSFQLSIIYLIPLALFIVGGFYGYLGVAIFSYISQILSANALVKGTIMYLIASQLGNALGIQTETFWNLAGHSFLLLIVFVVSLLIVAVFASLQLRNPEEEK